MFRDQLIDWRNEFSKWWQNEFKTIKFPSSETVFSYFIEPETKKLIPWTEKVISFELDSDIPLQVFPNFMTLFQNKMPTKCPNYGVCVCVYCLCSMRKN